MGGGGEGTTALGALVRFGVGGGGQKMATGSERLNFERAWNSLSYQQLR